MLSSRTIWCALAFGSGLYAAQPCGAATLKPVYTLPGVTDGLVPFAGLLQVGGTLYGTTADGGSSGRGTVLTVDAATGAEAVLHVFTGGIDGASPAAALTASGNLLYGTTAAGGGSNLGTVYSIDPASGAEKVVWSFTAGSGNSSTAPLLAIGGTLYGTAPSGGASGYGTVFAVNAKTGAETTLHAFAGGSDGAAPGGGLVDVGGTLYGVTSGGGASAAGTVYAIDKTTGAETVLYSFTGNSDGGGPVGELISANGLLYGVTSSGGTNFFGTVFSFNPHSHAEASVYSFSGGAVGGNPSGTLLNDGGIFYGVAGGGGIAGNGTVFSLNPATGAAAAVYAFQGGFDGAHPQCALIAANGVLYGTTIGDESGAPFAGTVFSINTANHSETPLHLFFGPSPFEQSNGALIAAGGLYYGTSAVDLGLGGAVYSLDPATGAETTLHAFQNETDGATPAGPLLNANGALYGVTTFGNGTIFKVDIVSGQLTTLYSFTGGTDGAVPNGGLLPFGGLLYGTTQNGGGGGGGTVFTIDPGTGALNTVYAFTFGADGGAPHAGLAGSGNLLYGTTAYGGKDYAGTVFAFDPANGKVKTLHVFTGGDGQYPYSALVASKGYLYGTTQYGGTQANACFGLGCGVVFKIKTGGGKLSVLHAFSGGEDGFFPAGALLVSGTSLTGTATNGGASLSGTVFSIDTKTASLTTLYAFTGQNDGSGPGSGVLAVGKDLIGSTSYGGTSGEGTVFSLIP